MKSAKAKSQQLFYDITSSGFVKKNSLKATNSKSCWLHLDLNDDSTEKMLNELKVPHTVINSLLEEETTPVINVFKKGILIILKGINIDKEADPEDMVSIRIWLEKNRIISVRKNDLKSVDKVIASINNKKGPRSTIHFMSILLEEMFDAIEEEICELNESVDLLEEKVIDKNIDSIRGDLMTLRRKSIIFNKYLTPQRHVIEQMSFLDIDWIDEKFISNTKEINNTITRYLSDLSEIRERTQVIADEISNIIAEKSNRNMYILSVISSIFLPLSFLTGLLGVNLAGIPGASSYLAFAMFCLIILVSAIVQIIILKAKKMI